MSFDAFSPARYAGTTGPMPMSDNVGFPAPPAESYCFDVTTAGTYYVRVSGFTSSTKLTTGTYSVTVALGGVPTPSPTPTATRTATPIGGGPSPTATFTPPGATATATRTATAAGTPGGGIAPSDIPTLSFPMLLVMALGLLSAAFVLIRRS